MAVFDNLSGVAGEIRTAISSEQFDLAGYTEQRIRDLIVSAFGAPLSNPTSMIRFTFIVGGGKLVRSRYSEDLPKWVNNALRDVGFIEDRSAAETFDSQGTYKHQHDTGQNLKYCIVFPRVTCANISSGIEPTSATSETSNQPEQIVVACDLALLKEIVKSKVTSWFQKKRLLKILQKAKEQFVAIEAKLIAGTQLSALEQAFYDSNSGVDDEKISWIQSECKHMVDNGQITATERIELIEQINSNIATCNEEIASVGVAQKKKIEKLNEKLSTLQERKAVIERLVPVVHCLRHSADIQKLHIKLLGLHAIEDKGRSISLTLADLKLIEGKSAVEDQIESLKMASKGWFQDEREFDAMFEADIRDAVATFAARKKHQYKESLQCCKCRG